MIWLFGITVQVLVKRYGREAVVKFFSDLDRETMEKVCDIVVIEAPND